MREALKAARIILTDGAAMTRVLGHRVAARWLVAVLRNLRECRRAGSLSPADKAMGEGPFLCKLGSARALLHGEGAFSGIREIWMRDCYLGRNYLRIPDNAVVVDLGANIGNFTMLALGSGPGVRVVAVECQHALCEGLRRQLAVNGWGDRCQIINALVGGATPLQEAVISSGAASGSCWIAEEELIEQASLDHVDLIKCDIEGSEHALFKQEGPLLRLADQIAVEIHGWGGNIAETLESLRKAGFDIKLTKSALPSGIVALGRRQCRPLS